MKILICDDSNPDGMRESVKDAGLDSSKLELCEPLINEDLSKTIGDLFDDVTKLLGGKSTKQIRSRFDEADIVLLDYGLTKLGGFRVRLTADHVAGYVRAFSDAPYLVALNELHTVDFDLKYLLGNFNTCADLALNTEHLSEAGLWTGRNAPGSFCPWYWPSLMRASERRNEQIKLIEADPDQPILKTLGFPPDVIPLLSRQAIAFLSPIAEEDVGPKDASDVRKVSFWQHFKQSNRSLPKDDRTALVEALGGDFHEEKCPKDTYLRKIVARVVAAELDFWFRRDILGPQRILIDAPHLQGHFRFRTDAAADAPDAWTETARRSDRPYGLDVKFFDILPKDSFYVEKCWVDHPSFWLPLIEADRGVEAFAEEVERNTELVFCEDTRRFCDRSKAKRFVTELGKGLDVRFVEQIVDKVYSPKSLFAR